MCGVSSVAFSGYSRLYCLPLASSGSFSARSRQRRQVTLPTAALPQEYRCTCQQVLSTSRRVFLSALALALAGPSLSVEVHNSDLTASPIVVPRGIIPDYTKPGPYKPVRLPRLEHICSECFPRCIGDRCLLRIDVTYPKGGGTGGPYPLAILTSGYLVGCDAYQSYADRLASWGYTAVLYDKIESVADTLNDEVSARMVTDIIDWCQVSPLMQRIADTHQVYLVGHSRGGKISCLAAAEDPRVAALCLIDPVDNTVYAPLAPGFPSAVAALQQIGPRRPLPLAVVGSGVGGGCVPKESNYTKFFESVPSTAWEVVVQDAGHFQFLDHQSALQRAVCPQGTVDETDVRVISQAVMVAWGEAMVRQRRHLFSSSSTSQYAEDPFSLSTGTSRNQSSGGAPAAAPVPNGASASTTASGIAAAAAAEMVGSTPFAAVEGVKGTHVQGGVATGSWGAGCLTIEVDRATLGSAGRVREEAWDEGRGAGRETKKGKHARAGPWVDGAGNFGSGAAWYEAKSQAGNSGRGEERMYSSAEMESMGVEVVTAQGDDGTVGSEGDVSGGYQLPTTRKRLESLVARLQYQTLLSLSSRFRNW